ncbi:hypothetical protein BH24BAC1_BH24BAC1_12630 [soil metagenome]
MKHIFFFVCLVVGFTSRAQQISITAQDMPRVDDTLRVSVASPTLTLDVKATGPNHTWNFSNLQPLAQRVERYVSVASTPLFYQLAFSSPLVTNRATIASPVDLPENLRDLAAANLPNFRIESIILFYRQTTAVFQELGLGATINGITAPLPYEQPDVIYRFPVEYSQKDSSLSSLIVNFPAQSLYYAQDRKRVNHADGWGTLTTPFGTFPVLRVVSTLYVNDTLRTADISGVRTQRPTLREYKWLGKAQRVPLLQINTAMVNGQEVILTVTYRDVFRNLGSLLASPEETPAALFKAYPSPLGATEALTLELPPLREPAQLTLFGPPGQVLFRQSVGSPSGTAIQLPASAFGPTPGLYLLRVETGKSVGHKKIMRN